MLFRISACIIITRLLLPFPCEAQEGSIFEAGKKKDILLLAGGSIAITGGYLLTNNLSSLSTSEINNLNPYEINSFDRNAIEQWNEESGRMSDIMVAASFMTPVILLPIKKARQEYLPVMLMYLETGLITNGLKELAKGITRRERPYLYNAAVPLNEKLDKDARQSFFSGHTVNSAALCFLTASVFSQYSENAFLETAVWSAAAALPAATGFMRYKAGKHFPSDIITGYIVGGATALSIAKIHRVVDDGNMSMQVMPTGLIFRWNFN